MGITGIKSSNLLDVIYTGYFVQRFKRGVAPLIGYGAVQEVVQIFAPGNGYGGSAKGIFHNQCPANDPCNQFAHGYIRISVGTTRNGNHSCKFGITKSGKGAANGRNYKGQGNSRAGCFGRGCGGTYKQAGANNSANT